MRNEALVTVALFCAGLLVTIAVVLVGTANASELPRHHDEDRFSAVSDVIDHRALERMRHEREKARAAEVSAAFEGFREAEGMAAGAAEAKSEAVYAADGYSEPSTAYEPAYAPTDGLTPEGGVNYHEGRVETYYSSNVAHHADTADWTLDDEGFYRDDRGRYVVAASDKAQGETFEGSKGECVVLDTGCAPGVTDYYVSW